MNYEDLISLIEDVEYLNDFYGPKSITYSQALLYLNNDNICYNARKSLENFYILQVEPYFERRKSVSNTLNTYKNKDGIFKVKNFSDFEKSKIVESINIINFIDSYAKKLNKIFYKCISFSPELTPQVFEAETRASNTEIQRLNELKNFIESYYEFSPLLNKDLKFEYDSNYNTMQYCIDYIINKYESFCYIITPESIERKPFIGIDLRSEKFSFDIETEYPKDVIDYIVGQILQCVKNGVQVIAIPIFIPGHANALIYKVKENTFEYFEPHGVNSEKIQKYQIDSVILKIIETLQESTTMKSKPTYRDSEQTCPLLTNKEKVGFQFYERMDILESLSPDGNSRLGYCQMWSLFYLELCLKFYDEDTTVLIQKAFDIIKEYENDYGFLIFITGYIYDTFENVKRYNPDFESYLKRDNKFGAIRSSNIESIYKIKSLEQTLKDRVCFNQVEEPNKSERPDKVLTYLYKNLRDNIIVSIEKDDIYFCYKRSMFRSLSSRREAFRDKGSRREAFRSLSSRREAFRDKGSRREAFRSLSSRREAFSSKNVESLIPIFEYKNQSILITQSDYMKLMNTMFSIFNLKKNIDLNEAEVLYDLNEYKLEEYT